ncbi:356_t:CDS:10, partial [Dentiscutata erythropus]
MESEVSFKHTEEFAMDKLAVGQSIGSWNKFDYIELYNEDWINVMNELALGQTVESWNELDLIELYNKSLTNVMNKLAINHVESHNENSANIIDEPAVGKYLENIVMGFVEAANMLQVCASCPKTTGILKINSVCLNYNHQISDKTNRFALKYQIFSEDMLNNIKFWAKIRNINMKTQYQILNHVEYEAATLLNDLLEHKFKDNSSKTSSSIEQTFPDLSSRLPDAIQIELDAGNHIVQELEDFMNSFINKQYQKAKK